MENVSPSRSWLPRETQLVARLLRLYPADGVLWEEAGGQAQPASVSWVLPVCCSSLGTTPRGGDTPSLWGCDIMSI